MALPLILASVSPVPCFLESLQGLRLVWVTRCFSAGILEAELGSALVFGRTSRSCETRSATLV